MLVTITASSDVFEKALASARNCDLIQELDGMPSILDASVLGKIESVWGKIEDALKQAYKYGKDKALALQQALFEETEKLIEYAQTQAAEVHKALLKRLSEYTRTFMEGLFASVPSTLLIGNIQVALAGIKLSQKLVATGSLKTNIMEALELAASGEVKIETEYTVVKSLAAQG
jgi:hypothetical protein